MINAEFLFDSTRGNGVTGSSMIDILAKTSHMRTVVLFSAFRVE